jgi:hypothetical protein
MIDNIPDDVANNDQRLKDTVAQLRSAGQKTASFEAPVSTEQKQPSAIGEVAEGAAKGLKQGTTALIRGAAEGAAATVGLLSDPITAVINQFLPEEYRGKIVKEAVRDLLTKAGIPENETAAQRIVQAGTEGLAGAVTQTAAGQALAKGAGLVPGAVEKVGTALAGQPVQQAAGGIGAGVASQGAAEAGAGPGLQTAAGLAGSVLGAGVGGVISPEQVPQWNPQTQLVKEGERAGVNLSTTDVFQPQTRFGKFIKSFGEDIPFFGTGGMQKAKAAERIAAVKNYAQEMGADGIANASDDVMRDLISKRKADFAKWGGQKAEVLTSPKLVNRPVPMTNTINKIDEQVSYLKGLQNDSLEPAIKKLEGYKKTFTNKTIEQVDDNRAQLGTLFKDRDLVVDTEIKQKVMNSLYGAVKKDIGGFIKTNSGDVDVNKWAQADTELTKLFRVENLPILKRAIKRGDVTPELIDSVLYNNDESTVKSLFSNITPQGVNATKSSIVQHAVKSATNEKTKIIDPDQFNSAIGKLSKQTGIYFNENDTQRIEGLTKVLNATAGAPASLQSPATGARLVLPTSAIGLASVIPGGPVERIVGTAAGMALAGGAARLYESKAVRDQLIKIANAKPGSEAEGQFIRRVLETIRAQGEEENK